IAAEQRDGAEDHARRAVSALERVGSEEGLLHRVQLALGRQSLDGDDLLRAYRADLELAASRCDAIDQHSTCRALSFTASELGTTEIEMVAQDAEEWAIRIGIDPPRRAVHVDFGDSGHRTMLPPRRERGGSDNGRTQSASA